MKKKRIILLILVMLSCCFGCSKTPEVYYQTPKGEWLEISSNQAKELLDALNNLELVKYEELEDTKIYGSWMYRFKIITEDGEITLHTSEYGIILYNDTYYIQSMFEKIFDISRNIYKGVYDEVYQEKEYTWYCLGDKKYSHNIEEWEKYNSEELFVDGSCRVSEIASWYKDTVDEDKTVEELFVSNSKTELNSVIEIAGNYSYTIKKISDYENVYLMKCNGPTLE